MNIKIIPEVHIRSIFMMLVILNVADWLLTTGIITHGGSEMNPYVQMYITYFGTIGILYAKIPPFLLMGVMIYKYWGDLSERSQQLTYYGMTAITYVYCFVIIYSTAGLLLLMYNK